MPMTPAEFAHRRARYAMGRRLAAALGVLPLLGVYLLVHHPWLKSQMHDHKHLMAALLIVVPLAWLLLVRQGWARLAPRLLGLSCPRCGGSIADAEPAPDASVLCPHCGRAVDDGDRSAARRA